jgi:mediator of RNA polymerase II transcription subunit 7
VLIKNPVLYQKKVDDLEVIFVNMHHLINSFRPHQARSYIISVLEEQVVKKRTAVQNLRAVFGNVEATMRQLSEQIDKEVTVSPEEAAAVVAPAAMEVCFPLIC